MFVCAATFASAIGFTLAVALAAPPGRLSGSVFFVAVSSVFFVASVCNALFFVASDQPFKLSVFLVALHLLKFLLVL